MIAVATENGFLVKTLAADGEATFGFHRLFGFISEAGAADRIRNRRLHHASTRRDQWLCRFQLSAEGRDLSLRPLENCEAKAMGDGAWRLVTPAGAYALTTAGAQVDPMRLADTVHREDRRWMAVAGLAGLALFLVVALPKAPPPPVVEEQVIEPITVKITTPERQQSVRVPAHIAATLPKVAAELRKGGKGGAAQEMLVGLGQGVKRTTVGNTGVAGLGGLNTKGGGPGGGAGGYGNTMIGSGTGPGVGHGDGKSALSALPLSQDIVLEGGLDRAVIQATIAKYLHEVRACYEKGLRTNPGLTGQITMGFEIGGNGKLNYSKVAKSTLGSSEVEGCVASRMMSWQFPKPVGGVNVKVTYPFLLRPVNS